MGTQVDLGIKGYKNYGTHLREKYNGQRVFKTIVDGGFTCPNRDGSKGYGGCTYCNVDSFTPEISRKMPTIREQLEKGMERGKNFYKADKFIVYFQPNTNTYAPVHYLKMMYDEALSVNPEDVVGFSVGTRPDCIDAEKVALLESYTDRYDVDLEMGMESIYDETLNQINRGCSHGEFV
ncbi:MAG: TIGR01212 family radical SAM protein, partial [Pedobacter sp.]